MSTAFEIFSAEVNKTFEAIDDAQEKIYGAWGNLANLTVSDEVYGVDWIHYAMISKKGSNGAMAKRMTGHLKTVDPEGAKAAKANAKTIRDFIKGKCEARGQADSFRMTWSRFLEYCVAEAGISDKYVSGEAKAKGTESSRPHVEFVGDAIRMLKNHLEEAEGCFELKDLWASIEEAAENDGILKTD